MAWCAQCGEDRPIQRHTFEGNCPICSMGVFGYEHNLTCRGATTGSLNVCTYCNEPVFAKAKTLAEYNRLEEAEAANCKAPKGGCFVITATMGNDENCFVAELRQFRDQFLLDTRLGTRLVDVYYRTGPAVASWIECSRILRLLAFSVIVLPATCIAAIVNRMYGKNE